MFLDARSIGEGEVLTTDVCIAGAGVAGLTIAREFKQADFKTCIIESGGEKPDKPTQALYWGENVGLPYYPLDTARARFLGKQYRTCERSLIPVISEPAAVRLTATMLSKTTFPV